VRSISTYLFILLFLSAGFSWAQDTVRIKEVQIQAEQSLEDKSVQRIDSLALADPTTKDLGASLQKYSHAFVKSYGIGSMASVSLRGTGGAHTNLLWNGSRLNSNSHGTADLSLYPPFFTEEVSLSYGQNSSRFGAGGLGGAVSLANQVSFNAPDQFEVQQRIGSFGYRSTAVKASIGNQKWRSVSRLIYSRADNDFDFRDRSEIGFPESQLDHADFEQRGLMQSFHYRMRADCRLDLHLWYMDTYRELPGMMAIRDLQEVQQDENLRAQMVFHQYFKGGKLSWNSSLINDRLFYDNQAQANPSESENLSFRNFLSLDFQLKKWEFNSRADFDWESARQFQLTEGEAKRYRGALYANAIRELNTHWSISIAARGEWIGEDRFFLPEAKISYQKTKTSSLWLLAGKNMKYPSLNDLYWASGGNAELEAEESENIELGHRHQIKLNEKLSLKLQQTIYYALISNYIQWVPTNLGFWTAENLKRVQSTGLESTVSLDYKSQKLSQRLGLNYNYNRSINLQKNHASDASVGKQLIYQPEHQYNLNSRTALADYYLDANFQFVGARYLQSDNQEFLPYFSLLDLSLGRHFKFGNDQLQLSFSVRNLLDEEYQAIQWRPMPGRNYMLSVNYRLR